MADENSYIILEMDPNLQKQIQECNLQIVNVTTPANFFHVLRRQVGTINVFDVGFLINVPYLTLLFLFLQIHSEFRNPLIVMFPKNLLPSKTCRSNVSEFDGFQESMRLLFIKLMVI
jgi:2-oxoglutarate dehydrogenase E1 component